MRSRCPNYMDFAGLQIHFLFRVLQEQPHVAFQNVKSIGDIGVAVPRHLLRRRELQLHNAKAGGARHAERDAPLRKDDWRPELTALGSYRPPSIPAEAASKSHAATHRNVNGVLALLAQTGHAETGW